MSNKKTVYIIVGIVLFVVAIPVAIALLGILGGFVYYSQGAR